MVVGVAEVPDSPHTKDTGIATAIDRPGMMTRAAVGAASVAVDEGAAAAAAAAAGVADAAGVAADAGGAAAGVGVDEYAHILNAEHIGVRNLWDPSFVVG